MPEEKAKPICGIVMPISAIDGCAESHWADVLEIITEAIEDANFEGNLVSNADDVGIIHKRIIQNLYDNPVVVCDVSGKNPNVMFELGLRLAFDKPTVIVKDDRTSYSFDTSAIEHLEYPRDLRFSRIIEFKQKLAEKISATYQRSTQDTNYTTFLKHFGEFKVAKIDKKEVSGQEYILQELRSLKHTLRRLEITSSARRDAAEASREIENQLESADVNLCLRGISQDKISEIRSYVDSHSGVIRSAQVERSPGHYHLLVDVASEMVAKDVRGMAAELKARTRRRLLPDKN